MDTNYWGCVNITFYALKHLIESKGQIVVISSLAGKTAV
jgi:NADP-dependent 3-hydroxy acid dehydrogenase YdfG